MLCKDVACKEILHSVNVFYYISFVLLKYTILSMFPVSVFRLGLFILVVAIIPLSNVGILYFLI